MGAIEISIGTLLAMLLVTSFVKIFTALSILRYGLGLQAAGFGIVILALALALSLVANRTQFASFGGPLAVITGKVNVEAAKVEEQFGPFIDRHTAPEVLAKLGAVTGAPKGSSSTDFSVRVSGFLLTELSQALQIGLLLLIPFVVIDILVVVGLALLGVPQMSPAVIGLPIKLLVFLAADGWTLLSVKLLGSYQ